MRVQLLERVPLFILIDTDLKGLIPFYDYVNELDDKPVLPMSDLDDITDYTPTGDFHVVDTFDELKDYIGVSMSSEITRWQQLILASKGVRLFSNDFDEDSPIYAGMVPAPEKIRRAAVDAANAETRAGHMAQYGVNYVGRTKLSPRNVFILDNKKGNPLHDPSKDATLEALYASLPADWWGSCGFVSSGNINKLQAFLESDDMLSVIPIGYTTGAFSKLKFMGLEHVEALVPNGTPEYGIRLRDDANRLSYKLSLIGQPEIEEPEGNGWLQL
jgi:hypothetical protein